MLVAVIITTVMVINLRQRVQITELESQLLAKDFDKLRTANESLAKSFDTMKKLREVDSRVVAELGTDLIEQGNRAAEVRSRLTKLEFENASVRQFLDTPSPVISDDVPTCMLDDSCD